jgi:hypothetical protein
MESAMKKFFTKVQPVQSGMYTKQSAPEEQTPYRIHLRLQPDGSGVLVVNAATVLHLNPTAAECAYHFIKGTAPDKAPRRKSLHAIASTKRQLCKITTISRRGFKG